MFCSSKLHVPLVLTAGSLQECAERQSSLNLLHAAPSDQLWGFHCKPAQVKWLIDYSTGNFRRPFVFQICAFGWLHYLFFLNMVCVEGKGKIKIVDEDVQGFSVWVCCLVSGGGVLPLEAMLLVWDGLSADQGQQYKFPVPPSWPASCTLYLQGGNGQKKRLGNRSLPLPACLFSGLKLPCSVLLSLCDSPRSSQPAK